MVDLIEEVTSTGNIERLESKRTKKARMEETDDLKEVIKIAQHLSPEKKLLFTKLAEMFTTGNFQENLFKSQFQLADLNPGTTFDEWAMFINDRLVRTYLEKHKRTLLSQSATQNLLDPNGSNKRDSLNLIKTLEEKEKAYSTQNIIIMRLPDKYE